MIYQLLREWPPGYGGVERVAHELGCVWGGVVYSFDVQSQFGVDHDPLHVNYPRCLLPSLRLIGRLHLPMPSRPLFQLLTSSHPLHGHLPSPGVLLLLLIARLLRPHRHVTAHWHCFLQPASNFTGGLLCFYQWFALRILSRLTAVVTTSPQLVSELERCGCSPARIMLLPCCLSADQEQKALELPVPEALNNGPLKVLFIGRLDSYKRLDWLLESLATLDAPWRLSIVGDGPKRNQFQQLTHELFDCPPGTNFHSVKFHGRLSEADKLQQLADSDLLVLPSDRSNEAFGIVQLEAMAAGRPALAFDRPRSGMGWVGQLPSFSWSQSPQGLAAALQELADQPQLRSQLSQQARERYLDLFARSVWLQRVKHLGDPVRPGNVWFSKE